jgi:hypothetical protein
VKLDIFVLFQILEETLSDFPHSLYCVDIFFLNQFVEGFYHEGMLDFIEYFSYIY